jgi:hypothetical protein
VALDVESAAKIARLVLLAKSRAAKSPHMAKGKSNSTEAGEEDGKPLPPIRVNDTLHKPVKKACKRLVMKPTDFVNQAVREKLEREGLWPPKPEECNEKDKKESA